MENQHRLIKGYRDLSEQEIALVNEAKQMADQVGELCLKIARLAVAMPSDTADTDAEREEAMRWVETGETTLQTGFMQLIRSITRPGSF